MRGGRRRRIGHAVDLAHRHADALQEALGGGQPHGHPVAAAQGQVRVALERAIRDQFRPPAGTRERVKQALRQGGSEIGVICAIQPQAGNVIVGAEGGESLGQCPLPVAAGHVDAQAAGKIEHAAHAGQHPGGQRQRRHAAIRLARDDDALRVDPALAARIRQRGQHVARLALGVAQHVAAGIAVGARGARKAGAHGQHHRIAAAHEFGGHIDEALALLQPGRAGLLAVIHQQQGKRTGAGGTEHRRLQRLAQAVAGRHHDHLLVQACIERQRRGDKLGVQGQARQTEQQSQENGATQMENGGLRGRLPCQSRQ